MKEKKTIQKSIRMTPRVNDYVNQFSGEGFNEKFENLVLFVMEREQTINQKINAANNHLDALNKEIRRKNEIVSILQRIEFQVNHLINQIGDIESE